METISYPLVLVLIFQCIVTGSLLLLLFRLRTVFGLSLFYITLGLFMFMHYFYTQTFTAEILPGIDLSIGSTVMYSAILFSLLLIYIKEDAREARKVVYTLILFNFLFAIPLYVTSIGLVQKVFINRYDMPISFFQTKISFLIVGSVSILLDSVVLIILYEALSKWLSSMLLRIFFTMGIVLVMHTLLFDSNSIFSSQLIIALIAVGISKMIAVPVYSFLFWLYLIYFEKELSANGREAYRIHDIFNLFTYRQKFQALLGEDKEVQRQLVEKTLELERSLRRFTILSTVRGLRMDQFSTAHQAHEFLVKVKDAFEVDACALHEIQGNQLKLLSSVGITEQEKEITLAHPFVYKIISAKKPLTVEDTSDDSTFQINEAFSYISCAGAPLLEKNEVIGIIKLYALNTKRSFSPLELEHLQLVASQASTLFQNAKLFAQNEKHKEVLVKQILVRKKAEAELLQTNGQLTTILQAEPECVKVLNRQGELLSINPAGLAMVEADNEQQVLDHRMVDLVDQKYRMAFNRLTLEVFNGNKGEMEFEVTGLKGGHRWLETHAVPLRNAAGEITSLLGVTRDISARKKAELEIKEKAIQLKMLTDNLPETMMYQVVRELDGEMKFTFVSSGVTALTGKTPEQIMADPSVLYEPIHDDDKEKFAIAEEISFQNMSVFHIVVRFKNVAGEWRILEIRSMPRKLPDGRVVWDGVNTDITKRKKEEEEKGLLNEKLLKATEIANFGFLDWNLITNDIYLSPQINKIYGIPKNVMNTAQFISKVVHPEDIEFVNENLALAMKGIKKYNIEHRIVRPDGAIIWLKAQAELSKSKDGKPERMLGTILDITESKRNEEQIKSYNHQLQELTTHLQTVREEERAGLARELHDELGQQLTALKMDLAWIAAHAPADQKLKDKVATCISLTQEAVFTIRKINSELRPSLLDDLGLFASLDYQLKEFSKRFNVKGKLTFGTEESHLDASKSIAIFRVFQESLTNIARHAEASQVNATIKITGQQLEMIVADDGKGLAENKNGQKKSFGILGMKERALMLGGTLTITSAPGKGTTLQLLVPL